MPIVDLVRYTAVRGDHVIADDVLACAPTMRGADAKAEMRRRARACVTNFGDMPSDRVIKGKHFGSAYRHE